MDTKSTPVEIDRDLWRVVRREEWTIDDWVDLHSTLQAFKARLAQRHQSPTAVRAEALAPSPDTGLPVQTFTNAEIAAVDRALQIESLSLELRGKVIQTIALSGRRGDHAEPAPSPSPDTADGTVRASTSPTP